MDNREKIDELLRVITRLEGQISWLLDRVSFYENMAKKNDGMSCPNMSREETPIYSKELKEQKEEGDKN